MKNTSSTFLTRVRMARILFLFSVCFLSLHSYAANIGAYAQQKNLTIEMRNKTVKEVLDYIEKNSEFIFFYYSKAIDTKRIVSLSVKDQPITVILDQLFKNTDVLYEIKDRQISLKREELPTEQRPQDSKQQKRKLVGTVTDASSSDPLVGVSISVKNSPGTGTSTDLDGKLSIEVSNNTELTFSYIGYKQQVLSVGDLGVLKVKMQSDNEVLDEVVVVGAGTQKKVSVTGAISTVKGVELRAPSSSLTNNLTGKLAGVVSMTTSGEPGSVSDFYIRGIGTFGGRATPLILMDDIEISSGDLNNIPTESIASFSILKDASATAIYGARGANGVLLIKTKDGMENTRAQINITFENSFLRPANTLKFVDGPTFMNMYNEALVTRTPSATPKYSDDVIEYTRSGINPYVYPNVDWYDLLFKNSTMNQRANINVQGGSSKVTYYMSLQANHDSGMLNSPKRYSFDTNINRWEYIFQSNISYKMTPTTTVELRMNDQIGYAKGPSFSTSDLFYLTYNTNPVAFPASFPAEEGDKHIRFGGAMLSGNSMYNNPYAYMINNFRGSNHNTINTSVRINQNFDFVTKGLSASILVNWKNYSNSSYTKSLAPYYYRVQDGSWNVDSPDLYALEQLTSGSEYISQSDIERYQDNTFYMDGRINYSRQFGRHAVSGMLMYMMREYRSSVLPNRNQGLSARITYDYNQKYLAEINCGYNGTERLVEGERFELFPAISLGWVISNEDFWTPLRSIVSFLKLRGSYGLVGSDDTGKSAGAAHFLYINDIKLDDLGYGTGPDGSVVAKGPSVSYYAVRNAHWERVKKFDIGIDMNLFNQLNIVFDYFHDKRDRILLKRGSFPRLLGYANAVPWSNIGKVDNRGIELAVNWRKKITNDLNMDLRFNLTYNKNKYIYKDEPDYPYVWQSETGKPLSNTIGYIAEGLFKDQADIEMSPSQDELGSTVMPGDIKYRDVNGDGKINSKDQVMISQYGNVPRIQYGIGLDMTYKSFDFGMFFNGSAQRTIMVSGIMPFRGDASTGDRNVMQFIANDYWSEANPNPDAKFPRLGITDSQVANNSVNSTYWMHNGRFIRFKTLELGYSFPYCRVYINGDNLAVWSPFKEWDPELSWNAYPLQRTINIGVQLKF